MDEARHHILIVDTDRHIIQAFQDIAKRHDYSCWMAAAGARAAEFLATKPIDVAVIDLDIKGFSGMKMLEEIRKNYETTEVIIVTGAGSIENAVQAVKLGAYDYLTKPFSDLERVERTVARAVEKIALLQKIRAYESMGDYIEDYADLVGKSSKIRAIFQLIQNISHSASNVLIAGESGTGKELVARAIHLNSPRAEKPFVVINCAVLSEGLLESELFGHVKGAFTGAHQDKEGLFAAADGGTIFLDEIAAIPAAIQVKLLRVLQNGEVRPVGASSMRHVDVRIISATNVDLQQQMRRGKFREDLYYRLHVINVILPPLRERREDISLLAYHFLKKYARANGKEVDSITIDAMQALQDYPWIGNVRELEHVIERAVVLCPERTITARQLPPHILGATFYESEGREEEDEWLDLPYQMAKEKALILFNQRYIGGLLRQTGGNISLAAGRARVDRNNFRKILRRYDIDAKTFKKDH